MPDNSTYANTLYNMSSAPNTSSTGQNLKMAGAVGANALRSYGAKTMSQGAANLYDMLVNQGRMDPRLLARQQAQNSVYTQRQQNMAQGAAARGGTGFGGFNQAMMSAISNAGQNRDQNLRYQDIADSYARNQRNLGILNENVIQPSLSYSGMGQSQSNADRSRKDQQYATGSGIASDIIGIWAK